LPNVKEDVSTTKIFLDTSIFASSNMNRRENNKVDVPWVILVWHSYYIDKVPHAEKLYRSFWWKDTLKQVDNFT
jgi:hypothetical protein